MINYLVVEDDCIKYLKIEELLNSVTPGCFIKRAITVAEGIEQIKVHQFSFVIIDFQLPLSEIGKVDKKGGIKLLQWIKKSQFKRKCCVPSNIICLTEYADLIEEFSSELKQCRVFAYPYTYESEDWKLELKGCINEYIIRLSQEINKLPNHKIVYSVHGIETNGTWQSELSKSLNLQEHKLEHLKHQYAFFPVLSFMIPPLRWIEINRFKQELEFLSDKFPGAEVTLVGHSFGTYLIAKSLDKINQAKTPKFSKVILCGSVIKGSFDWESIIKKHDIKYILNDCSLNDFPLVLSQALAIGLGMAGRSGFKRKYGGIIVDRYFKGGHSDFFTQNIFNSWYDFIVNGNVEIIDDRESLTLIEALLETIITYSPWIIFIILMITIFSLF
ncbi:response regulator [Pseudoalteromonas lipolytica]|uniref:response regulator n=1 Tax=Pseudoalteromonas lipolytica TaxID=570156 RepID=UPI0006C9F544|nr:response regulator [Pseudoalteromonas lipolytica]